MATCYTLLSCNQEKYANIHNVCNVNNINAEGKIVQINGYPSSQYYTAKIGQQIFFTLPDDVSVLADPNGYLQQGNVIEYVLKTFIYNGYSYINTPSQYYPQPTDINVYDCVGWNCSPSSYNPSVVQTTDYIINILQGIADSNNLPLKFKKVDLAGLLMSTVNTEVFAVEIPYNDTLEIQIESNKSTSNDLFIYKVNQNGTADILVNDHPATASIGSMSDATDSVGNIIGTVAYYQDLCDCGIIDSSYITITNYSVCPAIQDYENTQKYFSGSISADVDSDCKKITFSDLSNYSDNDEGGHSNLDFSDYIRIKIERPGNSDYIMSSVDGEDVDEVILPPSSGNHDYLLNFEEQDNDGIYSITICSYPTWNNSVNYYANPETIVFYNGILYKCLKENIGIQPDTDDSIWQVYQETEEEKLMTRYCSKIKFVVLCREIQKCYSELVYSAFCEINNDFCNDEMLCKNKKLLNAVKANVLLEALPISVDKENWNEVERQIALLKHICTCK